MSRGKRLLEVLGIKPPTNSAACSAGGLVVVTPLKIGSIWALVGRVVFLQNVMSW
jgi:hypothetical protein